MHSLTGNKRTFFAAALALIAIFAASAAPIPLYGIYQRAEGISYFELSLSSVFYFAGAVIALVIFGRLSNHLGRRPVAILAVAFAALASMAFLQLHSAAPLLAGRFLQGLSCGLASTALASWLADCAHLMPRWVAPALISCGPMLGLTLGGITSGVLVEYSPLPRQLPFYLVLAVLAVCIALLYRGKETLDAIPGLFKSLLPCFSLPDSARKAYPLAAVTFVCTWALGGFFQAFGPAIAHEQLHSSSAVAAALVFASIMAPSTLGASIAGKIPRAKAQLYGMLSFSLCVMALLLALYAGTLNAFLLASVLAGIAQGMVLSGSIQTMVNQLEPQQRANVLSVIYATSYTGAAVPTLLAGQMSSHTSLLNIAFGYGALALAGAIITLVFRQRAKQNLA